MKLARRKLYPPNWDELARRCKEQANWRCARCNIKQGSKRRSKQTGLFYRVFLHAAHVNHDPGNPTPVLICLCPTCHGTYDYRSRKRQKDISVERLKHRILLATLQRNPMYSSGYPGKS